MTSERERMLAGELDDANGPELVAACLRARMLLGRFDVVAAGDACRVVRSLA